MKSDFDVINIVWIVIFKITFEYIIVENDINFTSNKIFLFVFYFLVKFKQVTKYILCVLTTNQ